MPKNSGDTSSRVSWLIAVSIAGVIVVNAAGLWGIAVSRRGVVEEAGRLFRLETQTRARGIEAVVGQSRLDLVFLAGSAAIARLGEGQQPTRIRDSDWRRLGAEAALLIFLRGHPQVQHVAVRVGKDETVIEAGWRGGVPMAWIPPPDRTPAVDPPQPGMPPRIRGVFTLDAHASTPVALRLVAELNARSLLGASDVGGSAGDRTPVCQLVDGLGRRLAGEIPEAGAPEGVENPLRAEAEVNAGGWTVSSPWLLTCVQSQAATMTLVEALSRRFRLTLVLDLMVMASTLIFGLLVVFQIRRRLRLESAAREEARVRELERQLFHTERLATVGRVVAGIAHEINNPLEGMFNYLSLVEDDLGRGDAPSAKRRLEGVRQGVDRIAGVVSQVLVQADPATAPASPVDLVALARQSVTFVESRRAFSAISFTVDLPPEPLFASGRSVMLGQVILNLLLNACEAQGGSGEVRVRGARQAGWVEIEIADRGPGIPAADVPRIFEPFFSTKGSTGLGLSVCNTIVSQHGGELRVDNREGGGAVFRVRLPEWTEVESG